MSKGPVFQAKAIPSLAPEMTRPFHSPCAQVPDITTLLANRNRLKDITLEEGVAAVVKFGTAALVNASRQL